MLLVATWHARAVHC